MLTDILECQSYQFYQNKREQNPVFKDDNGTWYLTRYQDVKLLLADDRFKRCPVGGTGFVDPQKANTALDDIIRRWSLFNDPPEHTRLREMLGVMLNPTFFKETKELISRVADELISSLLTQKQADFMSAFAFPLPVKVINALLGTSLENQELRRWSVAIVSALDHGRPEDFAEVAPILQEIQTYFKDLIKVKTQYPAKDWISDLIKIKDKYQLELDDLIANGIFLLLAGHETVQLSLGLGLMTLLTHPDQLKLLQAQPDLVPSAVEELMRFEPPLNKISRWTSQAIELEGVTIPANQLVVGMVKAANRDPLRFEDPELFDITRHNNRHLAFGLGIHQCLGALLARFELQIAFTKLIPFLHQLTLIPEEIAWLPNSSMNYLFKLGIHIHS